MSLSKLIPSLGVSDLDRSITFYRDHFGFEVVNSYEEGDQAVWCHLRSGVAELMLQQLAPEQFRWLTSGPRCWVLYLSPEDLDGVHFTLREAGHQVSDITSTEYETRECFVNDPDGYELWISSPAI